MIISTFKLCLLVIALATISNCQILKEEVDDLRGDYVVRLLGNALEQKPQQKIHVVIGPFQVSVKGCNSAIAIYNYLPESHSWQVGSFKEPGMQCVIHQDRSVMFYLQQAVKAYRDGEFVVFEDKSANKLLQLGKDEGNIDQFVEVQPIEQEQP